MAEATPAASESAVAAFIARRSAADSAERANSVLFPTEMIEIGKGGQRPVQTVMMPEHLPTAACIKQLESKARKALKNKKP